MTEVETTFGVRTAQVDPRKGLRINGETGAAARRVLHHDNGPLGAAAIDRAEERRIELLKAAGFNAIRAAHNPLSLAMLDACDRLGMLVMDEAFDMWTAASRRTTTRWTSRSGGPPTWSRWSPRTTTTRQRDHVLARQRDRRGRHAARRQAGPADGRAHPRLDRTRLVTNGVNAALAVLDELPAVSADGGLNEHGRHGRL